MLTIILVDGCSQGFWQVLPADLIVTLDSKVQNLEFGPKVQQFALPSQKDWLGQANDCGFAQRGAELLCGLNVEIICSRRWALPSKQKEPGHLLVAS